ncbi:MAG: DUF2262 domain-containing protein [Tannerellaceae bacterium]|jgi:hypothetical protein|nr:DUF2262 domain-containing protein [Tannerellaceae bacterium]
MNNEIEIFNAKFGDEIKEISIITGTKPIVYAKVENASFFELSMEITAWKPVESKEIFIGGTYFVTTKADNNKIKELSEQLLPDSIISLKVKQKENLFLLIDFIENRNISYKFNMILKKQVKPVMCLDKLLGTFILDKRRNVYTNKIKWNDHSVTLEIENYTGQQLANAFMIAKSLVKDQTIWHLRIIEFAARRLVKIKNKIWLDADETEIKKEAFMQRIKLESIYVSLKDQFKFYFNDGDIFWGCPIIVSGNLQKGPMQAKVIE